MSFDRNLCKVLVADDSRLVTSSVTAILRQLDLSDIYYAYKPFEVINLCKQMHFDLVICDYNFQTQLNGFQLLEELKHAQILPAHTTFVFLTGENDHKIVRSIVDCDPDDYLLKPFNHTFFRNRLLSAMKRRSVLLPIYEKLREMDFEGVIEATDTLLPFHPEYSKLIRRYRAHAMVQNKQFSSARSEYEKLLKEDNFDWIKTALANTLIETDDLEKAQEVLESLSSKKENPYYHDEMSNMAVLSEDIPKAIKHLKQSTMLLDAGSERELVITNLSLASESYDDAVTYIKRYYEKNENTFRGGIFTKLNFVRCHLYRALNAPSNQCFENLLFGLNPLIGEIEKNSQFKAQFALIDAHIALIRGDLKAAISQVRAVLASNQLSHFYDLYHLCALLERCSFLSEMKSMLPRARRAIAEAQHPSIFRSQVHMLKSLEVRLQESQTKIEQIRRQITAQKSISTSSITPHFDRYFQLHDLLPHSKKICLAIVRLASLRPFEYRGEYAIYRKLEHCDRVIRNLCDNRELQSIKYNNMYQYAKQNITVSNG
ncbi:response regulator [Vibrio parahaemolyticus]|uniref:response regulator n=1 Tax=Vibrio parahaemolyticus TaxID=670 RepID=UPI0004F26BA8|nr:response regulator [Vibrio parahaemolyticus]EJG0871542.1 response regulator [Vibrio parahaemolyticus O3]EJG0900201.1 response regulator [Vibrio parahaemolyticus O3:K56]EJG1073528.1 response regulator [Vibrio parahaemolyticus O1:K56]EGQ8275775.1 response regulator [Vibrio parahaemolyticus]EGR1974709.1 response regulator [Vibrio parahaemolyticus]